MLSLQNALANVKTLAAKIQNSTNGKGLVPSLTQDLKELLGCEAIALFALDKPKRQLVSVNLIAPEVPELRVDISHKTLVGYVAANGKSINVANAYSRQELSAYHPDLTGGSTRDAVMNFKTKSAMVIPLPHNKKLLGVLEVLNKLEGEQFTQEDLKLAREIAPSLGLLMSKLEEESQTGKQIVIGTPEQEEKLHSISHSIHAAKNVDEILLELKDSILELFDATLITIYAVDVVKNEIYSKVKSGDSISEIRVPISPKSIAGCVAMEQRVLNTANAYDPNELKQYHPDLVFDSSWDKKSGFKTKSVLASPLVHQNKLMGVMQLINKKSADRFSPLDEKFVTLISDTVALAFHNHAKFVQPKPTKFSYLVNNGLIAEEELTAVIARARKNQIDIETLLLKDVGIKRKELGKSLESFYNIPYEGYNSSTVLPQQILTGLNKTFLLKNFWIPLQSDESKVIILINDPTNIDKIQNIKLIFPKKQLEFKVGLKVDIVEFLNSVMGSAAIEEEAAGETKTEELSALLSALKSEKEDSPGAEADAGEEEINAISETDSTIVRLVNKVLIDAYEQGVSDIHIEPGIGKESMLVRYRKDGECRIYEEIPFLYKQAIISRIK
ncbi:MAG: GAF domain-containing protein, partial [Nitrospinae bacterium]|nr:GAF domain-containing protein [Nitrospinota bacterium]